MSTENKYSEQDLKELKEAFDDWFGGLLLLENSSCLYRDVLRQNRKNLWNSWLEIRPIWLTSDIEKSKAEAKNLAKLFDEQLELDKLKK